MMTRKSHVDIAYEVPFTPPPGANLWNLFEAMIDSTAGALRVTRGGEPQVSIDADLGNGLLAYRRTDLAQVKKLADPEPDYRQPRSLCVRMSARPLKAEINFADGQGKFEIWGRDINPGWNEPLNRAAAHARFYCEQSTWDMEIKSSGRVNRNAWRSRLRAWWERSPTVQKVVVAVAASLVIAGLTWVGAAFIAWISVR